MWTAFTRAYSLIVCKCICIAFKCLCTIFVPSKHWQYTKCHWWCRLSVRNGKKRRRRKYTLLVNQMEAWDIVSCVWWWSSTYRGCHQWLVDIVPVAIIVNHHNQYDRCDKYQNSGNRMINQFLYVFFFLNAKTKKKKLMENFLIDSCKHCISYLHK